MPERDSTLQALLEAIDAYAAGRAPELVAEARAAAEAKVRSTLVDALAHSMLEAARAELAPSPPRSRVSRETRPRSQVASGPRQPRAAAASADDSEEGSATAARSAETGYYVYGIVSPSGAGLPSDLSGVERSPVGLIEHRGLAAIASRVSLASFGEEQLREHLNDIDWLEETARGHEAVLEEALSRTTVVPLRLCTIYRSEAHVKDMLDTEREQIADALARLHGRTEWGVKLIAEPGALERAVSGGGGAEDEDDSLSPGVAYMRDRSRESRERDELDRIADSWADETHERLAAKAAEALVNPIQNAEVSGHTGDMLLNGAYLVADADLDEFRAEVAALTDRFAPAGASVELTGPWPPYNFVAAPIEATG